MTQGRSNKVIFSSSRRQQLRPLSCYNDDSNPSALRRKQRKTKKKSKSNHHYNMLLVVVLVICFWAVVSGIREVLRKDLTTRKQLDGLDENEKHQIHPQKQSMVVKAPPQLSLSRIPNNKVSATTDVRGNLGPIEVILQANPGTDWLHDRWQAASNMHGKEIPAEHWIQLEFLDTTIWADKIILDWETAYAQEYILEASMEPIVDNDDDNRSPRILLFDGRNKQDVTSMRSVTKFGRSPAHPLHVVHEIRLRNNAPFRFLRLRILNSVTEREVSLWQFDVYGVSRSH